MKMFLGPMRETDQGTIDGKTLKKLIDDRFRMGTITAGLSDEEWILTVCETIFMLYSKENFTKKDKYDINSFDTLVSLRNSIIASHNMWIQVTKYVSRFYGVELLPITFILMYKTLITTDNEDDFTKACNKALDMVLDGLNIKEVSEGTYRVTKEDIEEAVGDTDDRLLFDFFSAFKALGTFHKDYTKYDSDEDRKNYRTMMSIYEYMFRNKRPQ